MFDSAIEAIHEWIYFGFSYIIKENLVVWTRKNFCILLSTSFFPYQNHFKLSIKQLK